MKYSQPSPIYFFIYVPVCVISTAHLFHNFFLTSQDLELLQTSSLIFFFNAFNHNNFNKVCLVFQVSFSTCIKNAMGVENNLLPTQSSSKTETFIFQFHIALPSLLAVDQNCRGAMLIFQYHHGEFVLETHFSAIKGQETTFSQKEVGNSKLYALFTNLQKRLLWMQL